jgi:hypothetical protein
VLSWVVILSPHSLQALRSNWNPSLHPSLFASSFSRKSFPSIFFRTLCSHFQTSCTSNSFAINHFRTLCKIPGIGYPPPSLFLDSFLIRSPQILHSRAAQERAHCAVSCSETERGVRTNSFVCHSLAPRDRGVRTHPPATLLFVTLTKTTGVGINSSQNGNYHESQVTQLQLRQLSCSPSTTRPLGCPTERIDLPRRGA